METSNLSRLARAVRKAYDTKKGRHGLEGAEAGFTLIELMVVLLIMAILLAIAIPTFLGVKGGAQDRAIQSDLTNALTSAKAAYANSGSYATTPASEDTLLSSAEPNLTFTVDTVQPAKGANTMSVGVSTDGYQLVLVGYSASGNCFAAEDNEGAATAVTHTPSAQGVEYAAWKQSVATCQVSTIPAAPTGAWTSSGYPTP